MSSRRGPPKHQNRYAWKPDAGCKKNETELGGKLRPYPQITGVCVRCKEQIEWKRRYGKYKPLVEPSKCHQCGKRAVQQAYHTLCPACAKQRGVCAKCSRVVDNIVGRDMEEARDECKKLEEAIKNSRERDRRTLLRVMNTHKPEGTTKNLNCIKNKLQDSKNRHHSDCYGHEDFDSEEGTGDSDDDYKLESREDIDESRGDCTNDVEQQVKRLNGLCVFSCHGN